MSRICLFWLWLYVRSSLRRWSPLSQYRVILHSTTTDSFRLDTIFFRLTRSYVARHGSGCATMPRIGSSPTGYRWADQRWRGTQPGYQHILERVRPGSSMGILCWPSLCSARWGDRSWSAISGKWDCKPEDARNDLESFLIFTSARSTCIIL